VRGSYHDRHVVLEPLSSVMPALGAGIHVLLIVPQAKTWMAGTSPAMTHALELIEVASS
jgi:hypothetical protein